MQNMETFFGFKVFVKSDLDPEDERVLRLKAQELIEVCDIDLSEYYVYLHQLVIRAKDSHFNVGGGLSKRVKKINIEFHINKKQRENKDIRFMNHILKPGVAHEVKPYFNPDWIGYDIPISYFETRSWFQNAIIAFVRKEMRHTHKKIKAVVTTSATSEFANVLHSRKMADIATELDLRFERNVQLKLPLDKFTQSRIGENKMVFNNYGNVGAFGPNSVAYDFTQNLQLQSDLTTLRDAARKAGKIQDESDIESVMAAISAKKHMKILDYMKKLGGWTLESAGKLGLSAAEEAIKAAIGS